VNAQDIKDLNEIYIRKGLTGLLHWVIEWEINGNNPDLYHLATWYIFLGNKEQALSTLKNQLKNGL